MGPNFVAENYCNFHNYMKITKKFFKENFCLLCYEYRNHYYQALYSQYAIKSVSLFKYFKFSVLQWLSQPSLLQDVTVRQWQRQWVVTSASTECTLSPNICINANTLFSPPVINLVFDAVPSSRLVWPDLIFMQQHYP